MESMEKKQAALENWPKAVLIAMGADVPVLVEGPPGVGKSNMIENEVHAAYWKGDKEAPLVVLVGSQHDPTDIGGPLAVIGADAVRLIPQKMKPLVEAGRGTLFVEELTSVTSMTQAALMRVVLDREVGDVHLPKPVRIIAACNPSDVAAGGTPLTPPLANRFAKIRAAPPSPAAWGDWLCSALVATPEQRSVAASFAAFARSTGRVFDFPEDEGARSEPWMSPRSLFMAAKCYAGGLAGGSPDLGLALVQGAIGPGHASELGTFLRTLDLPDPRKLLSGIESWKPESNRPDRADAVLRAVASEAANGPARDERERETLVSSAWKIVRTACDVGGLADIAYGSVGALSAWRVNKSKDPNGGGMDELAVLPRFFKVGKAVGFGAR